MEFNLNKEIRDAVIRSQHCQRNWDLSRQISEEDMSVIVHAATQCPSKQNIAYYKAHFITNREIIEAIHECTEGFMTNFDTGECQTNSQTLANLLIVFEDVKITDTIEALGISRNNETHYVRTTSDADFKMSSKYQDLVRDQNMAIGIAAGYVNLASSIMGYSTGCCACFDGAHIKDILKLERAPVLLMGVGFKDPNRPRREHQLSDFVFPAIPKQEIKVTIIK